MSIQAIYGNQSWASRSGYAPGLEGVCSPEQIAVVIPLFNHRHTVRDITNRALQQGFSVYVVDDGSSDQGWQEVQDLPMVHLLRHGYNQGKGTAIMTGLKAASAHCTWAVTVDADGQHSPEEIPQLLQAVPKGNRPLILGARTNMDGADVPWTSRWGRSFSNFWVQRAGGPRVCDSQSGFRLYPLPEALELKVRARRYQFEIEFLVKSAWKGVQVFEVPIKVNYSPGPHGRRTSHFRPFVDFLRNAGVFHRLIVQRIFVPAFLRAKW
jgi:glycosyltransferase involved in cell wall biosynthesis